MISLQRAKTKPALFRRLTGLTLPAFEELMHTLNRHYPAFEQQRLTRPNRQRAIGAGGKFKRSLEERVLMTLFALRFYPTWALLGFLFDLDESNAFRNVQMTKAFLAEHLPLPKRVRKQRIGSLEELLEEVPELQVLIDGTEQPIQRPKDPAQRRRSYSGKKKRCTVKTQVVQEASTGLLLDVDGGYAGSLHDKRMFEASGVQARLPLRVRAWVDKGYVGLEGVVPEGWVLNQPKKKPPGGALSEAERAMNRAVNTVRVQVEHGILRMKRYQVFGGLYRGRLGGYRSVVELVAGLVNLERMRALGLEWWV